MKRVESQKTAILEQLRKSPIIQVACEKVGISRQTYYRYRDEDPVFAKEADNAIEGGVFLVNDLAESQLISAIKDRNITAIMGWLKHRHPSFKSRIEISGELRQARQNMTEEEFALLCEALQMAGFAWEHILSNDYDAQP